MNAETSSSTNVNRLKLTHKKSFKEKLFSFHHESKPKLKDSQTSSHKKGGWKSLIINKTSNSSLRRNQSSNKLVGLIQKLTHSPPVRTLSDPNLSIDTGNLIVIDGTSTTLKMTQKSQWKPSLDTICNDSRLLSALITFMERSYNEESILFLQAVQQLNTQIHRPKPNEMQIDHQIRSIFQRYIAPTAEYQINLSSDCFTRTTEMCQHEALSTYSMHQKRSIFDAAVAEVNRLMLNSVLGLFYDSDEFQSIAQLSSRIDNSVPVPPPIVLSMSHSALSVDVPIMVESDPMHEVQEMDVFSKDEMVFMNDEYFNMLAMGVASSPSSV